MMSIDHQKDHFKRTRDEEQSHDNSQSDIQLPNSKRRKINGSKDGNKEELDVKIDIKDNNKDDAVIIDNNNTDEFDTKMFRSYIKSALDALDNNNTIQIDTLANQISLPKSNPDSISSKHFIIVLSSLINNISKLDSIKCDNLIFAIINYPKWYSTLTNQQILVFKSFIITLCSYLPKWWNEISQIIIKQFTLSLNKTKYHHELLKYFLQIIPTSIQFINKILVQNYPNKHNNKSEIINYVSNLLKIMDYCNELKFNIWSLIIERTIQIDVELQNELDELDDEDEINLDDESDDNDDDEDYEINDNENNENNDSIKRKVHFADEDAIISDDDDDDEINEDEDDLIEEEEINEHDLQSITITDLSEKLDSILYLIFQNLSEKSSNSKNNDDENIVIQYNTLTSLFKSHILPTYFTKSTQFILFYYTQQSPELIDSFLVTLIDLCFSPQETIDKRIKALQYLSSYLSRAKNLQKPQIVFVISYLISWLNKYVKEREYEINGNVNMDRFKLFYSTFQVLLYVFCFRHSILKKDEDNSWELNIDKFFQRMIITKFNPLKFCNENVVLMFGKISQEENVAYCFSIIQKNKNEKMKGISGTISSNDLTQSSSSSSSSSKLNLVKQQFIDLEGYFPFDPLFLKTSKKFLQNYYIEWNDIKDEYQSDSDSDDFDDLASDAIKEVVRRNSMNQSN